MATRKVYTTTKRTGAGTDDAVTAATVSAMTAISKDVIADGAMCLIMEDDNSGFYAYKYNASGTAATSAPDVYRPNDYTVAGNWENQSSPFGSQFPIGAIIPIPYSTLPANYLECNGAAISRATYSALFAAIGTLYGAGDGSTTFNIPDFRGEFLRGYDHGAGIDPSAASRTNRGDGTTGDAIGTKQAATDISTKPLYSTYDVVVRSNDGTAGTESITSGYMAGSAVVTSTRYRMRPRNVSVMYCIKY